MTVSSSSLTTTMEGMATDCTPTGLKLEDAMMGIVSITRTYRHETAEKNEHPSFTSIDSPCSEHQNGCMAVVTISMRSLDNRSVYDGVVITNKEAQGRDSHLHRVNSAAGSDRRRR
jgi:hypothetical protein